MNQQCKQSVYLRVGGSGACAPVVRTYISGGVHHTARAALESLVYVAFGAVWHVDPFVVAVARELLRSGRARAELLVCHVVLAVPAVAVIVACAHVVKKVLRCVVLAAAHRF